MLSWTRRPVIGFANEWRYYGGPGVDDPLIGLLRKPNGTSRRLYYVTDGSGRQLVVADDTGARSRRTLGPNTCRYDPDGNMSGPCDNDSPNLAYDGPNVVIGLANEWRFCRDRQLILGPN